MAIRLNLQQRIAAIRLYYSNNGNSTEASRQLTEEFDIQLVQGRNIKAIVTKFNTTGSVKDAPRSGRPLSATTDAKGDELLQSLERSPQKSTRRLSSELEICQRSVVNLMKKKGLKPYRPHLLHALHDGDEDRRLEYAENFLDMVRQDETILDRIYWSDEATFKLNGHINRHNCIYWASENPHITIQKEVNLPGVTVWAALASQGLIGPFFFEGTVNGHNYLNMLRTQFFPLVQNHENDIYFQQDGAPPHYAREVREWLDNTFDGRWLGRRGPVEYPARSPDLTPLDFFLWGAMKQLVYSENPRTVQDLRRVITEKFAKIQPELCMKVCRSVAGRLGKCIQQQGGHFEHLL